MMKKAPKTNAMRILDTHRIDYREILYDSDGFMDGVSIAEKLGQPVDKTFKTLVTVGKSKNHYVFMIPVKDITAVTGYIRGGCSPLGMKKQFRTVVDQSALDHETILFSGGRRGAQIEMDPRRLPELIDAAFCDVIMD